MSRCFIVGNGPSLWDMDLTLMQNDHSWGVNQVHMIYQHTSWRPDYMTFAEMTAGDEDWFPKIWEAVRQNPQAKKFARDDAWWWTEEMDGHDIVRYNACTHHDILDGESPDHRYDKTPTFWHLPQVCKFGGSIPMTIQLAFLEGFTELYLIGCDLGHKEGTSNHFHPGYATSRGITPAKAIKRNEANRMGHVFSKYNCPVPIFNAGIGGELEVYERVDYKELFE